MSEERPQEQTDEAVPETPKASVGERLRAAREARGMDADAVAAALKLSRRQIEALDAGDWAKLPGHTFIRGFVRNYARVVGLDAAELLTDVDMPAPRAPRLEVTQNAAGVMPEAGHARKRDYATAAAGLVVVALAVVAYFLVPPDLWQPAPQAAPPAAAEPAPVFPPPAANEAAPAASEPAAAAQSVPAGQPVSTVPAAAASAPAATGRGLQLSFTQPSWVEIRDRSGQIIFSQLNAAGSERVVDGQPPFVLVVGNAANVTVRYQGRQIALEPRSKDDVARVTVE